MADAIPVVSQVKSAFQFVCGDSKGARETQKNFTKKCPGVAQIRSALKKDKQKEGEHEPTKEGVKENDIKHQKDMEKNDVEEALTEEIENLKINGKKKEKTEKKVKEKPQKSIKEKNKANKKKEEANQKEIIIENSTESLEENIKNATSILDSTPVIGHVKGVSQIIAGDTKGGTRTLILASRTSLVTLASVGSTMVGGPVAGKLAADYVGTMVDATCKSHLDNTLNEDDELLQ